MSIWRARLTAATRAAAAWNPSLLVRWTQRKPLAFASASGTVNVFAGDLVVQLYVEERKDVDVRRLAVLTTFGFGWIGVFQYCMYTKLFPAVVRASGLAVSPAVALQVMLDQICYMPFVYFPMYYAVKGVSVAPPGAWLSAVGDALLRYRENLQADVRRCWVYWVPIQGVAFASVPIALRVPFMSTASFVWFIWISAALVGS